MVLCFTRSRVGPSIAENCPIFALAVYIFTKPRCDGFQQRPIMNGSSGQTWLSADPASYFSNEDIDAVSQIGWAMFLEQYPNYPDCFKRVIPYPLASIVHQFNTGWPRQHLSTRHPIWQSRIFTSSVTFNNERYTNIVTFLRAKVLLERYHCKITNMQAHYNYTTVYNKITAKFS